MKANDLRQRTIEELKEMVFELSKEQFALRMQKGVGQVPKSHQFKSIRKEIARIRTVVNEKEAKV